MPSRSPPTSELFYKQERHSENTFDAQGGQRSDVRAPSTKRRVDPNIDNEEVTFAEFEA